MSRETEIINNLPVGLIVLSIDNGVINVIDINNRFVAFANEVKKSIAGNENEENKVDLIDAFNRDFYVLSEEEDISAINKMLEDSKTEEITYCKFRLRGSSDDNTIWIMSCCSSKINDSGKRIYYVTFTDVTKDVHIEELLMKERENLKRISFKDALTQLYNRNALNEMVNNTKKDKLKNVGVMFADVNGLKLVNDSFGHSSGDKHIVKFATILKKHFPEDVLYRISGDEFVVVMPNVEEKSFINASDELIADCKKNDDIASIGFLWSAKMVDVNYFINKAEKLMYVEKQMYYMEHQNRTGRNRSKLLTILLDEMEQGRYEMFLQPKAFIGQNKVTGAEALVRRKDSKGNIEYPSDFISQLEKDNLVTTVDYFVIEQACKTLKRWKDCELPVIRISVNVSRITLCNHQFLNKVEEYTKMYEVDPQNLEFEITKSLETVDYVRIYETVSSLCKLGYKIALDDIGSFSSSLNLLLTEGISAVKLDRSLILKLDTEAGEKLMKHIIEMCHDLNLNCIAEGVENTDQLTMLEKVGCDMYQGFMFSEPVSVEDFENTFF